jgi:hypothetical protein
MSCGLPAAYFILRKICQVVADLETWPNAAARARFQPGFKEIYRKPGRFWTFISAYTGRRRTGVQLISFCNAKPHERKGETMKHNNKAKALTVAAVFALEVAAGPAAKAADRGCSNATLRGSYTDQDTGTIVGVGPFAGVNVDSFDGKGHLTVSGMFSVNGNVSPGVETGTYTVNPDCTGSYTVEGAGLNIHAFFVIDQGGNELQIVITDPGTVINCVARKQFPEHHD